MSSARLGPGELRPPRLGLARIGSDRLSAARVGFPPAAGSRRVEAGATRMAFKEPEERQPLTVDDMADCQGAQAAHEGHDMALDRLLAAGADVPKSGWPRGESTPEESDTEGMIRKKGTRRCALRLCARRALEFQRVDGRRHQW